MPLMLLFVRKVIKILRDPIDRFCSAVRYAIQKWSNDPNVRRLINLGIIEPNQFAEILSDKNHLKLTGRRAINWAAQFPWDRVADKHLAVYNAVVERKL